jgi:hypothetical protein
MPADRYELVLRREDEEIERVRTDLDPVDRRVLQAHLLASVLRFGGRERDLAEYVLEIYRPGRSEPDFTYTAAL